MTLDLRGRLLQACHSNSTPLFLALGINAFGAGMFFPFAILYYQAATSLSVASIGLALTSATLVTLAVNPVTGVLVDRLGARRLVVAGNCLEAVGFAAYLAVSSAATLFAAALLATAGTRMFFASSSALIAESVAGIERDRWYGLVGITQTIWREPERRAGEPAHWRYRHRRVPGDHRREHRLPARNGRPDPERSISAAAPAGEG
jgi:MFS family permease